MRQIQLECYEHHWLDPNEATEKKYLKNKYLFLYKKKLELQYYKR